MHDCVQEVMFVRWTKIFSPLQLITLEILITKTVDVVLVDVLCSDSDTCHRDSFTLAPRV